ncbi:MAG: DNA-binding response regulator [Gammaproteobacteria bacterium RIFCSPLOWO2_12_47_11]|nr:MAG: DNA-binding response regulator [Gammaproteobacteria bacterium RIFCSPLOWO2_12_47_11]
MRLLLIEDDEILGDGIVAGLKEFSYITDWLRDGRQMESAIASTEYDAIILDLGLPGESGLTLLVKLRKMGKNLPVLILTARDTIDDKVKGLDLGADDYMIKPFDLDELAARLRALIRRDHGRTSPLLKHNDLEMNPAEHSVVKGNTTIELSAKEFSLLQLLMENSGKALSKRKIEDNIYAWSEEIESNAIEVHIHNIRKKIGPDIIKTIRDVGYIIK